MKSTILSKIKILEIYYKVLIAYYLIYNTFFGWNRNPISDLEKTYDDISKILIYLSFGFIIHIFLAYVKFKMHYYKSELNNRE